MDMAEWNGECEIVAIAEGIPAHTPAEHAN